MSDDSSSTTPELLKQDSHTAQKYVVNYCMRLKKKPMEILKTLRQVYRDIALSRARVYALGAQFKQTGSTSERKQGSGRPSTSLTEENSNLVDELIKGGHRVTLMSISDTLNISYGGNLKQSIRRNRPHLIRSDKMLNWTLHQDNIRPHKSALAGQKLQEW